MRSIARPQAPASLLILALSSLSALAQDRPPTFPELKPDQARALDRISADSLKGHLSFLASDLLEGRDTPSRGLDLAAEYIAAQFRRAGLEAVGDDGYFQTASWEVSEPDSAGLRLEVVSGGTATAIDPAGVTQGRAVKVDVAASPTFKLDLGRVASLDVDSLAGKVVLLELPDLRTASPASPESRAAREALGKLGPSKAALIVMIGREPGFGPAGLGTARRLIDPKNPEPERIIPGAPRIAVSDPKLVALFDAMRAGPGSATIAFHANDPIRRPVKIRNVVGLLRGSDPALKDTCVMVTAHYDHLGIRGGPEGTDRIFNGANDDGSGTVSVVELASALGSLKEHPKRSILFATWFGEEKGLLGSRYYGRNPIIPIDKTIADLNLEQVGRTDDVEGAQVARASLTGFGYSEVSAILAAAGQAEGVSIVKHPRNSDAFFGRSDNQALADLGVPAHTLCVAFQFPDYHGLADHWDKLDYPNMARVDRAVARALLALADDPAEPMWDATNPRASKYLKAWKDRRGK